MAELKVEEGMETIAVFHALRQYISANEKIRGILLDETENMTDLKKIKNLFTIGQDVSINRQELSEYPVIQMFKINDFEHYSAFRLSDMTLAIQVDTKKGDNATLIGELIPVAINNKFLYYHKEDENGNFDMENGEKVLVALSPARVVDGRNIPTNTDGIHGYLLSVRVNVRKSYNQGGR